MGYGPIVNGKQKPITRWENSWAYQEQLRREQRSRAPAEERVRHYKHRNTPGSHHELAATEDPARS